LETHVPLSGQPRSTLSGGVSIAGKQGDLGTRLRKGMRNPQSDPSRSSGYQGNRTLKLSLAHRSSPPEKLSTPAGSPAELEGIPRALRLFSPERTSPGPSSRNRSAPASTMAEIDSDQRTGEVSCFRRSSRATSGSLTGPAVTFEK